MKFTQEFEFISLEKRTSKKTGEAFVILYALFDRDIYNFLVFDPKLADKLSHLEKHSKMILDIEDYKSGDSYKYKVRDVVGE